MRRRSRRTLLHLAFFGGILFLIVYLNRPQSRKSFAWSTIQYKTSASTLPEPRGVCPGLTETSKPALIVSRVAADGNYSWLDSLSEKYHLCVYNVDAPPDVNSKYLQVPANRGHEAMAYLTFLIDNYEDIPSAGAVFVHGSRWAWHNDSPDYDNAALLAALNLTSALSGSGYHNLRCDWSASTCPASSGPAQGSFETSLNTILQPWSARSASDAAMPGAFATLFGGDKDIAAKGGQRVLLGRNDPVRAQCCAQFVVSKASVHQHSREEYFALRQWLLDGSGALRSRNSAPRDDRIAGRIISYLWHILFLRQQDGGVDLDELNRAACPSAEDCYCKLYGRCDVRCPNDEMCFGQYRIPPGYSLPADWAEKHSKVPEEIPRDI